MDRLLRPPDYVDLTGWPLVFLSGPIQGAPDWQSQLGKELVSSNRAIYVASPRRETKDNYFSYAEQKAWELTHIKRAAKLGVVAFWFAARDHSLPYEEGRAYAQTSRIEIGKVLGWRDYDSSIRVAVGFDPDYSSSGGGSERYVRDECKLYGLPVAESIDAVRAEIEALL